MKKEHIRNTGGCYEGVKAVDSRDGRIERGMRYGMGGERADRGLGWRDLTPT